MKLVTPDVPRRTMGLPLCCFTAALLASGSGPAWGDRPLTSETADVIEQGQCQVEANHAVARTRGSPKLQSSDVTASCGIDGRTQLALGGVSTRGGGIRLTTQFLAGKTTLLKPEPDRTGWGVAYRLDRTRMAGSSAHAERSALTALATRELTPTLLAHANLGWTRERMARQNTTTWSLGVETVGSFTIAADVFGDDRSKPAISAGVGWVLNNVFSINAVAGVQTEQPRTTTFGIGMKIVF